MLLPVRNAAATLEEALRSMAGQTFEDWEALLVDDGSSDGSLDLLRDWECRDARFRVLRAPRPGGIAAALNLATAEAAGPLLARMDADDVSLPRRLELQVERLDAGDVTAVGCWVRYFPQEEVGGGARRYEAWLNSLVTPEEHDRDLFVECPLAHPTMLMPARSVRAAGGYRDVGWPEDYDLCFRLWEAGGRFAKVPEVLFHWREGPGRASRTRPAYRLEAFVRCKVHYLLRGPLAAGRPAVIFGAGPVGKSFARALRDRGGSLAAFVDLDPRKIGQKIHGARVLAQPEGLAFRGRAYGLAAVGQPGARELLRSTLLGAGWSEGEDFRCVA